MGIKTIHFLKYGVTACLMPGVPKDWPENHKWVSEDDKDKVNCRACLLGMEHGDPTFQILEEGKAIKCCRCGMISHNQKDIEHHWCGNCKMSHDDIWPPARRAWVQSFTNPL
jgi:ribosomal protein L37E